MFSCHQPLRVLFSGTVAPQPSRTVPRLKADILLSCVLTASLLSACNSSDDTVSASDSSVFDRSQNTTTLYGSVRERNITPNVEPHQLAAVIDGINRLSLDMYLEHGALTPGENTTGSGYSLAVALGMLNRAGAESTTQIIQRLLGLENLPESALYPALNQIDLTLASRNNDKLEWRSANQALVAEGYQYNPLFLDTLTGHFGAPLVEADFFGSGEAVKEDINQWASDATDQMIPQLLDEPLHGLTRLVLLNAVVLDALWEHEYQEHQEHQFVNLDNTSSTVVGFGGQAEHAVLIEESLKALELPYGGGELALLVVQPEDFSSYEPRFDLSELGRITAALATQQVALTAPNWKIDSKIDFEKLAMTQGLAGEGVRLDLSRLLQESGLEPPLDLEITPFFQKAVIEVDKDGTRAAAVTLIGGVDESVPLSVKIEKPFLYFIRDIETGLVLFAGRVLSL